MERVVTINLNGNPYQLEEPAYDALRAYLGRADAALTENPDRAEIVRDLEQAIADKCAAYLSPHKTVVNASEMSTILDEMGPVETEAEGSEAGARVVNEAPRKRLYRVRDDAKIAGVCAGIGAYFDIDANIIRLLFIVATLFTSGFVILIYIALMFLVPSAHTSEEWAAAHGIPFNAQEVIDRAKREYARFADDGGRNWRAQMRAQRRAWREQMRSWRHSWDYGGGPAAPPAQPVGYLTRIFAGLFAFIFSIITAALLIAFLVALFSLLGAGAVLGWAPPEGVPIWLAIVVLCIAYAAISAPFSAMRRASYATLSGHRYGGGGGSGDSLVTLAIVGVAIWLAWMFLPDARLMMEQAYLVIRDFAEHVTRNWIWD
jgi:phage shock protein PspC (stress-responsive transcriptional regulator)